MLITQPICMLCAGSTWNLYFSPHPRRLPKVIYAQGTMASRKKRRRPDDDDDDDDDDLNETGRPVNDDDGDAAPAPHTNSTENVRLVEICDDDASDADLGLAVAEVIKDGQRQEKRAVKRRQRMATAEQKLVEVHELARRAPIIVALDMSLTSSGMTIIDRRFSPSRVRIVAFAQTKQQLAVAHEVARHRTVSLLQTGPTADVDKKKPSRRRSVTTTTTTATRPDRYDLFDVCISLHSKHVKNKNNGKEEEEEEEEQHDYANQTARFEHVTATLMSELEPYIKDNPSQMLVAIEAYAFHMMSSSVTVLAELGGVMRNKLFRAGVRFVELSPTTIKRWFTGSGAADKKEMWRRFSIVTKHTLPLDKIIPGSFARTIPSPHSDIVDSFAAAVALYRS
jgi:Holliday junction resolvasome RuvABC endonuclease subunit